MQLNTIFGKMKIFNVKSGVTCNYHYSLKKLKHSEQSAGMKSHLGNFGFDT
jgi:hypothetical protein